MEIENLILRVEVLAGTSIEDACIDAIALADHLRMTIEFKANGVSVLAKPGVEAEKLAEAWRESFVGDSKPKIACAHPER